MIAARLPTARWASAISASVPPSPRLSARVRMSTYLSVTMTISDQKISDRTPSTAGFRDAGRRRSRRASPHGRHRADSCRCRHRRHRYCRSSESRNRHRFPGYDHCRSWPLPGRSLTPASPGPYEIPLLRRNMTAPVSSIPRKARHGLTGHPISECESGRLSGSKARYFPAGRNFLVRSPTLAKTLLGVGRRYREGRLQVGDRAAQRRGDEGAGK